MSQFFDWRVLRARTVGGEDGKDGLRIARRMDGSEALIRRLVMDGERSCKGSVSRCYRAQ